MKRTSLLLLLVASLANPSIASAAINTTAALVTAVRNGAEGDTAGLESPLKFECGVHGEFTVNGWEVRP